MSINVKQSTHAVTFKNFDDIISSFATSREIIEYIRPIELCKITQKIRFPKTIAISLIANAKSGIIRVRMLNQ